MVHPLKGKVKTTFFSFYKNHATRPQEYASENCEMLLKTKKRMKYVVYYHLQPVKHRQKVKNHEKIVFLIFHKNL